MAAGLAILRKFLVGGQECPRSGPSAVPKADKNVRAPEKCEMRTQISAFCFLLFRDLLSTFSISVFSFSAFPSPPPQPTRATDRRASQFSRADKGRAGE